MQCEIICISVTRLVWCTCMYKIICHLAVYTFRAVLKKKGGKKGIQERVHALGVYTSMRNYYYLHNSVSFQRCSHNFVAVSVTATKIIATLVRHASTNYEQSHDSRQQYNVPTTFMCSVHIFNSWCNRCTKSSCTLAYL